MEPIYLSPQSSVAEIIDRWPNANPIFVRHHMSCVGCSMATFETVEDATKIYQIDITSFLEELAQAIAEPDQPSSGDNDRSNTLPSWDIKELFMTTPYTFFPEISEAIETIPTESIVSRTVYKDDHLKAIVFAFAPGQELSEHTASVPAIIQILEGECQLTLGTDSYTVKAGAWARMPANLSHSIVATTPVKMLLLMLP